MLGWSKLAEYRKAHANRNSRNGAEYRGSQQWRSQDRKPTEFTRWKRIREGNDPFRQEALGPSGGAGEERAGQLVRYELVTRGKRTG